MLDIRNLKAHLDTKDGIVKAVDGVSFTVNEGETVGIVGESGSGKSILASSIMQLNPEPPAFYPKGEILLNGRNLLELHERELCKIRGSEIAMVFQDPMSSLNPVFRIGDQLTEAIRSHQNMSRKQAKRRAVELLTDVGIPDPESRMTGYPHQFSGGMRQRVLLAMALAGSPKLLIADEPTTALDVTIQAQILDLLKHIQQKYGMAILIISHDLGVIANLADKVMVMYAGRIVEQGRVNDIFYHTSMPYTWSLLHSIPRLDTNKSERLISIAGQPPNLIHLPAGCSFYPRCPFAKSECRIVDPELTETSAGHQRACLLSEQEFYEARKLTVKGEV